jgi:DNA-binding FrmR family transcriptional regulator
MTSSSQLPESQRDDLLARLKRIEGQARGIQKMLEEGRDCTDILNQVAAIKAATNVLSTEFLESFALYCLRNADQFESPEAAIQEAVRAVVRAGR